MTLGQRKAVKQPVQLPGSDLKGLARPKGWPIEQAFFQSPIVQPKAIVVPKQNLELVLLPVTEHEERLGEGIKLKQFLDDDRQSINRFSEVCRSSSQIHPLDDSAVHHNFSSVRRTFSNNSSWKPLITSISTFLIFNVSVSLEGSSTIQETQAVSCEFWDTGDCLRSQYFIVWILTSFFSHHWTNDSLLCRYSIN
jgi:hypothetical protein